MIVSKVVYWFRQLLSEIWLRVAAFSVLSVMTALVALLLRGFLPASLDWQLGADAVQPILNVLASSMLAVSTFSLGIMASAVAGAANGSSPRATQLLLQDRTSQNVLATFLGAFIYSLVGIIALRIGIYDQGGRIILMGVTIIILIAIFVSFIRWVDLLRVFGRIPDTLNRIEQATTEALTGRIDDPYLGYNPLDDDIEIAEDWLEIKPAGPAYVRHIDLQALNETAARADVDIIIARQPGDFASGDKPLAYMRGHVDAADANDIRLAARAAFSMGNMRDFFQDPRFGMIVLAETASRALSAAVNDPGTAIDIARRGHRILSGWTWQPNEEPRFKRLWLGAIAPADMFRDLFRPIARDAAGIVEVQLALQKTLLSLTRQNRQMFGAPATREAEEALARADHASLLDSEKELLRALVDEIRAAAG